MNSLAFFYFIISFFSHIPNFYQKNKTIFITLREASLQNINSKENINSKGNSPFHLNKVLKKNKSIRFYNDNELVDLFIKNKNCVNKQCFYIQIYSGHDRKVALEYLKSLYEYVDKKYLYVEYFNTIYKLYIGLAIEKLELSKLYMKLFEIFHNIRIMSVEFNSNTCNKLCLDFNS